jgi:predicted transglutaminase-like cysteine proteinase
MALFFITLNTTNGYSKTEKLPKIATTEALLGELPTPYGWRDFCRKFAAECAPFPPGPKKVELTPENWQILQEINETVNHKIEPVSDLDHWGVVESWDLPTDGKGDCEDYALLKRKLLALYRFPPAALLMTIVYNKRQEGHAILTVTTDRGDFILDNQTDVILAWDQTGYRYVERQSQNNPNIWVRLNENAADIVVSSENGATVIRDGGQ